MLTDEQRKFIEQEEQFRYEVRKRLEAAAEPAPATPSATQNSGSSGFGGKVYEFFNSTLGMWFLSSVVLTGGAALIQDIQHRHEIAQKNREQLDAHRFEITHRLDQMEYGLRRAKTVGEAKAAMDSMFKAKFPLTPELQNRTLGSLYFAIYELLSGTAQQKTAQAIAFLRRLEEAELALQSLPDDKPLDPTDREHLHKLIKSIKDLHLPSH